MDQNQQINLRVKLSSSFRPGAPIDTLMLFAGRQEQISDVINGIMQPGRHIILFGERGVGKTSLARVLIEILSNSGQYFLNSGTINCDGTDDFSSLWHKIFREIFIEVETRQAGFGEGIRRQVQAVTELLSEKVTPDDVRYALARLPTSVIITLDEVDRLKKGEVTTLLADTIKNLSDHVVNATLVLVGVADAVNELIEGHKSIERALLQVPMPRMSSQELEQIIDKGLSQAGMTIEDEAKEIIVRLSRGLPHYTHLLGLYTSLRAIEQNRLRIEKGDVSEATTAAVQKSHSLLSDYNTATSSPQRQNLYREVLLACALAPTDELEYFSAADVVKPLSAIMKRKYEIPSFVRHLNEFASEKRGAVLKKTGERRRYRYRFINPLMQPFIVIHGLSTSLLSEDFVWTVRRR
jgi:Cdc6-like AAA superfamily ATPase